MTSETTQMSPSRSWAGHGLDGPVRGNVNGTIEPLDGGARSPEAQLIRPPVRSQDREIGLAGAQVRRHHPTWVATGREREAGERPAQRVRRDLVGEQPEDAPPANMSLAACKACDNGVVYLATGCRRSAPICDPAPAARGFTSRAALAVGDAESVSRPVDSAETASDDVAHDGPQL